MSDDEQVLDTWIDGGGYFTERKLVGGHEVIVHHADIPDSDITVVRGIPVTTVVRTLIDCAPDMPRLEFVRMVRRALDRRLFRPFEAYARIAAPDMESHTGAPILGEVLDRLHCRGSRSW